MKTTISLLALGTLALVMTGCDMLDMPSTTKEMDNTTQGMAQTTKNMSVTTDAMNSKMEEVRNGAHLQVLIGSLTFMFDDKNTQRLSPVPFDMLAGAKKYAEEAHEDEIVDWFYVQLKNVRDTAPDPHQKVEFIDLAPKLDAKGYHVFTVQYRVEDRNGTKVAVPKTEWGYPISYINTFNHKADVVLSAMEAVASFIPQPMIEKIVNMEIVTGGLREQTALAILNMRDAFTRHALLESSLYEDGFMNLEQVKEAERLVNNIDYIAHLPKKYQDLIAATDIHGYLNVSANYVYSQQADQAELAAVKPIEIPAGQGSSYTAATVDFQPSNDINNPSLVQSLYDTDPNDKDGLKVKTVNQSAIRKAAIKFDSANIGNDWQELLNHFQNDLSDDIKSSPEGQSYLSSIQAHLR